MSPRRERILVTGKDGQVGWELRRTLAPLGEVVACGRQELDLANVDQIRERIRELRPAIVVNAGVYSQVDRAEEEPQQAMAVNGIAPGVLAEEAKAIGALFVHFSSDYVFPGTKGQPYTEDDAPDPQGAYGKSKLEGERAVEAVGGRYFIFRTSWVYGLHGKNFLKAMVRFFRAGKPLRVVDDQIGTPTWSRLLAEITAQVLAARFSGVKDRDTSLAEVTGLYQVGATGETSWHGFAQAIIDRVVAAGDYESLPANAKVTPIPSSEFPQAAKRPPYSVLSKERFERTFGWQLPPWEEQLDLCLGESEREDV